MRGKFIDLYLGIFISNISLLTGFSSQVGNGFSIFFFFGFKKISNFTLRKCVVLQPLLGPGLRQRAPSILLYHQLVSLYPRIHRICDASLWTTCFRLFIGFSNLSCVVGFALKKLLREPFF